MTDPAPPGDHTVYAAVRAAAGLLAGAGVATSMVDATALAAHVLGVDPAEVDRAMVLRHDFDEGARAEFDRLVAARCARRPLQHLTGVAHFRRLTLGVGPGVFVPRPETELAAGLAIDAANAALSRGAAAPVVVDLCTGSGAIALAVADEVPTARVHAVELSPQAHDYARRNVESTGLPVTLTCGDARAAYPELDGTVDVVVSNPPYIPDDAVPQDQEVRDHDPELALYGGGDDGLALPLQIARRAAGLLKAGGVLVMEHADTQGQTLPAALERSGHWVGVTDVRDLTGRPRVTVAVRRPS